MQQIIPDETATEYSDETILLVEDEDLVRRLIAETLRQQGYRVLEAADGLDALDLHRDHPDSIDLVLTDVVMPRMSGRALAERLKHRHPNVQVLYMSGYPDDSVLRHGIELGAVSFIQKPFTPQAISEHIREMLRSKSTEELIALA